MAGMQFVVPQFIEVESKIIGPISARQFIELLVTFGFCYITYKITSPWIFIPSILIGGAIGITLAFVKVNGMPMHYFALNLTQTLRRPNLKLWQRVVYVEKKVTKEKKVEEVAPVEKGPMNESRLAEMSLMVDTGGAYASQEVLMPQQQENGASTPVAQAGSPVQSSQPAQEDSSGNISL